MQYQTARRPECVLFIEYRFVVFRLAITLQSRHRPVVTVSFDQVKNAMLPLSQTLDRFQPSAISQIFNLAVRLKEEGCQIADFSTGEADFDTPDHIKIAAKEAVDRRDTKYTAVDGTSALKSAIQAKFERDNKLNYEPGQIFVHSGAKPLLADIFRTMLNPGDEVIVPAPCWPSHPGAILAAGGVSVFVHADVLSGYRITHEQLEAALPRRHAVSFCARRRIMGQMSWNSLQRFCLSTRTSGS